MVVLSMGLRRVWISTPQDRVWTLKQLVQAMDRTTLKLWRLEMHQNRKPTRKRKWRRKVWVTLGQLRETCWADWDKMMNQNKRRRKSKLMNMHRENKMWMIIGTRRGNKVLSYLIRVSLLTINKTINYQGIKKIIWHLCHLRISLRYMVMKPDLWIRLRIWSCSMHSHQRGFRETVRW